MQTESVMPNSVNPGQSAEDNSAALENGYGQADSGQMSSSQPKSTDMRATPRSKYKYSQRIAPLHSKILPRVDDYLEVECNDISCGGISFFLRRPPGCEHFAVALGQKSMTTLLIAQVVYIKEVNHNNQQMYLVGCKFVDRIED